MTGDKENYYNISASKGFSYLIPYVAQDILKKLLKQLPAAARPIYHGYYGDLMASRACAQDSSNAMVTFIQESFPKLVRDHNRLASIMNAEIDNDWHSYIPVKMPIVADMMGADPNGKTEVVVQAPQRHKKNDAALASGKPKAPRIATPLPDTQQAPLMPSPPDSIANAKTSRKSTQEINVEDPEAPEPWNDSLWPHGPWVSGLEVIDKIPRFQQRPETQSKKATTGLLPAS